MPTYEYKCEVCGHVFERFQSITAKALRKCEKCGKRSLRRMIGAGGAIIFRGPGFYVNDYQRARSGKGDADNAGKKE